MAGALHGQKLRQLEGHGTQYMMPATDVVAGYSDYRQVYKTPAEIAAILGTNTHNIYTVDGTLAGDRQVAMAGYDLAFTGGGNFGIGPASPSFPLHVIGSNQFVGYFANNAATHAYIGLDGNSGSDVGFYSTNDVNAWFSGILSTGNHWVVRDVTGATTPLTINTGDNRVTLATTSDDSYHLFNGNYYINAYDDGLGTTATTQLVTNQFGGYLATTTNNHLTFQTNSTNAMRLLNTQQMVLNQYGSGTYSGTAAYNLQVDASGNVIETAVPAAGSTDYVSNVTFATQTLTFTGIGSAFNSTVDLSAFALDTDLKGIYDGSGNVPAGTTASITDWLQFSNTMRIDDANEEVGIGTTNPITNLHVYDATADAPVRVESGDAGARIEFVDNNTTLPQPPSLGALGNNLEFKIQGGTTIMSIDADGVGINQSNPTTKLEIYGDDDSFVRQVNIRNNGTTTGWSGINISHYAGSDYDEARLYMDAAKEFWITNNDEDGGDIRLQTTATNGGGMIRFYPDENLGLQMPSSRDLIIGTHVGGGYTDVDANKVSLVVAGTGGIKDLPQDGTERMPMVRLHDNVSDYGSGTATVGEVRGGIEWYTSETSSSVAGLSGAIYSVNENTYNTNLGLTFHTMLSSGLTERMHLTSGGDLELNGYSTDNKLGTAANLIANDAGGKLVQVNLTDYDAGASDVYWELDGSDVNTKDDRDVKIDNASPLLVIDDSAGGDYEQRFSNFQWSIVDNFANSVYGFQAISGGYTGFIAQSSHYFRNEAGVTQINHTLDGSGFYYNADGSGDDKDVIDLDAEKLETAGDADYFKLHFKDNDGGYFVSDEAEFWFYETGKIRLHANDANWWDLTEVRGAANTYLKADGSGGTSWTQIDLTTDVTGVLPTTNYAHPTLAQVLTAGNTGAVQFGSYGAGTNTGTGAYDLQVDASGNVIEVAIAGGTDTNLATESSLTNNTGSDNVFNLNGWDVHFSGSQGIFNINDDGDRITVYNSSGVTTVEIEAQAGVGSIGTHTGHDVWLVTQGSPHITLDHSEQTMDFDNYGAGTNTGTAAYMLAVTATGDLIEEPLSAGGLFTDGGATTYLTATGDNLALGGTSTTYKFDVTGTGRVSTDFTVGTDAAGNNRVIVRAYSLDRYRIANSNMIDNYYVYGTGEAITRIYHKAGTEAAPTQTPADTEIYSIQAYARDDVSTDQNMAEIAFETGTAAPTSVNDGLGRILFKTSRDGTAGVTVAGVFDEDGDLGVGTTTPDTKVQISGSTRAFISFEDDNTATNLEGGAIWYDDTGNVDAWIGKTNNSSGSPMETFTQFPAAHFVISNRTDHDIRFYVGSSDNLTMVMEPTGEVGLGTATEPNRELHIGANDTETTGHFRIEQDGTGDAGMVFEIGGLTYWSMGIDNSVGDNFAIHNSTSVVSASDFVIKTSSQLQFGGYGAGTHTGTAAKWLAVDASGNLIEEDAPAGGSDSDLTAVGSTWYLGTGVESLSIGGTSDISATWALRVAGGNSSLRTATGGEHWIIRDDTGTAANEYMGYIMFDNTDGGISTVDASAMIAVKAAEGQSSGDKGADMEFYTKAININGNESADLRMIIEDSGDVGIGVTTPTHTLEVNGGVEATSYLLVARATRLSTAFEMEVNGQAYISSQLGIATGSVVNDTGYEFQVGTTNGHKVRIDPRYLETWNVANSGGMRSYQAHSSNNVGPQMVQFKVNGTGTDYTYAVLPDDHIIGGISCGAPNASLALKEGGFFLFRTNGVWSDTQRPTKFELSVAGNSNVAETMMQADAEHVYFPCADDVSNSVAIGLSLGSAVVPDARLFVTENSQTSVPTIKIHDEDGGVDDNQVIARMDFETSDSNDSGVAARIEVQAAGLGGDMDIKIQTGDAGDLRNEAILTGNADLDSHWSGAVASRMFKQGATTCTTNVEQILLDESVFAYGPVTNDPTTANDIEVTYGGLYRIRYSADVKSSVADDEFDIRLYVNGSALAGINPTYADDELDDEIWGSLPTANEYYHFTTTFMVELNAGDDLTLELDRTGGTGTITAEYVSFEVERVSWIDNY